MASQTLHLSHPQKLRVLAIGNSLVEGYTDFGFRFHPYTIKLEAELKRLLPDHEIEVDNDGLSGDTVQSRLGGVFLQRLQRSCPLQKDARWDLVVILGGTNDLGKEVMKPDCAGGIFEALKECYEHVLRSKASLLCLSVPERAIDGRDGEMARRATASRLQLNHLIAKYVEELQLQQNEPGPTPKAAFYYDLAAAVPFYEIQDDGQKKQDSHIWSVDGLHMNEEGYDYVGELLAGYISSLVKGTAC